MARQRSPREFYELGKEAENRPTGRANDITERKRVSIMPVAALFVLFGVILAADLFMPFRFTVWILYVFALLLVSNVAPRFLWPLAGLSAAFTIVGFFFSSHSVPIFYVVINRTIGISMFGVVAWLLSERVRSEQGILAVNEALEKNMQEIEMKTLQLGESEAKHRSLFENSIDGVLLTIPETGEIVAANPAACSMLGMTEKEIREAGRAGIVVQDGALAKGLGERSERRKWRGELTWRRKDGSTFPVGVSTSFFMGSHGTTMSSLSFRDITERKRMEEELRKSHDELELRVAERTAALTRLAAAVESAAESVFITDSLWHIEYANPAFCNNTGYGTDEVIGREARLLWSEKVDPSVYQQSREAAARGKPYVFRIMVRRKDGTALPVDSVISPVKDASGEIRNFVIVWRDMREQLRLEEQLRQSHKMEAIGTLAGGIAHDFNNMLAIIIGNAELVLDDTPPESEGIRHNLNAIFKAGKRGRDLVKQILAFSRKNEQEQKNQHLAPLVEESFKLLRASIPSTIEMKLHLRTKSDSALVNGSQFHEILMNLCTNAAYAMSENGGTLEVSLEDETLHLEDPPDSKPRRYLKLTVSDTGEGMDEEVKKRIFDPFFTTKAPGEGTGMGLAVVYGIVQAHNGLITVQSEPGKGSSFSVLIPKVRGKAASESESEDAFAGGEERIMFVDDEDGIVDMATSMLVRLGYNVASFTDPEAALGAFTRAPQDFDLVITDQTMPNVTGVRLAERLLAIRKDLSIILCTGFSHFVDVQSAKDAGIKGFVMKPLTKREIAKTIRQVLDE